MNSTAGSDAAAGVRLDEDLWERALEIHRTHAVLNLGVMSTQRLIQPGRDIGKMWQGNANPDFQYMESTHLDLPRIRRGGVNVLGMMACAPARSEADSIHSPLRGLEHMDVIYSDILGRYPEDFELAMTAEDVHRIRKAGKIALLLGMQAGDLLGGSIRALRTFRRLGVQYVTLTHAWSNDLVDSSTGEARWDGLSETGREMVREMNRIGVIPDITHTTDKGAFQVLELSKGPVIASHSNCRALCDHLGERNLSDELIRGVAETGGTVSVNFSPRLISQAYADAYPRFMEEVRPLLREFMKTLAGADVETQYTERMRFLAQHGIPYPTHEEIVDHVEHIANLVGWEYVGIGSDFDGTGLLERHLEDVSKIPMLTYELLRRGHAEPDLVKFLGENTLRVLEEARALAGEGRDG